MIMVEWGMRAAAAGDVEAVAALKAVVMRGDLERLGRWDEDRARQRVRERFDPAWTWIIEVDGAFGGSVALRPEGDAHWLEHFYLDPRYQGAGIGAAVLRRLLDRCDREGTLVRLDVLQGSAARRLYERHGFVFVSEDPIDVFMARTPQAVTPER
jgi:GNAT superfamily N-acetyltransferase